MTDGISEAFNEQRELLIPKYIWRLAADLVINDIDNLIEISHKQGFRDNVKRIYGIDLSETDLVYLRYILFKIKQSLPIR